jgi:hypothetical protein
VIIAIANLQINSVFLTDLIFYILLTIIFIK